MICHSVLSRIAISAADGTSKIDIKELGHLFESRFNPVEQHDAHELFIYLCNMIQEEAKLETPSKPIEATSP